MTIYLGYRLTSYLHNSRELIILVAQLGIDCWVEEERDVHGAVFFYFYKCYSMLFYFPYFVFCILFCLIYLLFILFKIISLPL